jgi:hypothetical protein
LVIAAPGLIGAGKQAIERREWNRQFLPYVDRWDFAVFRGGVSVVTTEPVR